MMNKMTAIFVFGAALFATGCTTTSEVMERGDGTYTVTSAACPACGGTSKSAELAMEKAMAHCAESGKKAVMHDIENRNLNAVGAGGSGLKFSCATDVSVEDVQQCYETDFEAAIQQYGEVAVSNVKGKVLPEQGDFGFAQLSDNSFPSTEENAVILSIGATYEKCQAVNSSDLTPAEERVFVGATNRVLALIADLSAAKITFGEYAASYNNVAADVDAAGAELAAQYRANRRADAEARMRARENFNTEVDRILTR
jgi:hypothetical protein